RHGAALGVERRLEGSQAFQGGFRANGFVVVDDLEEAVLVVALHRDNFILEQAFDGRLVRQAVRAFTEGVLLLAGDAVHLAEHFGGQAHHAGRLGGVQRQLRVRVDAMHHADVAHVLDTTDDEHVAIAGHDRLSGSVQRAHRRTAQAADGLRGAGVRNAGQQRSHAGDVPALLQGLVDAAPDHIFHFCRVDLRVAREHAFDQLRGHGLGAGVAVHAALGTTHRGTAEVDNDDVSRIKAHIFTLARLTVEALAVGSHFTQLRSRVVQRAQVGVLVGQRHELGDTDRIDVPQCTPTEGRETDAIDQAHVGFGGGLDDPVFQAANGFQAQRDHHVVDDVLVGQLAGLADDRLEQLVGLRVDDLLRLALLVHFIGVEALAVLLAQAVGLVHDVDRGLAVVLHAIREAFGHDVAAVVAGIHADDVHQVSRAHGPAELLHHLVGAYEVDTVGDGTGETAEVREQNAVDQEARAIVDHDRALADLLGVGDGGGDG